MGRFDDKVAWITGASAGIGRALALELAREGAAVAVSARRRERLDELVAEIEAAGGQAAAIPCDVTDEAEVEAAVAATVARFGRLDVAIANAGFGVTGLIERLEVDDWRRQMEVNVLGLVATCKHALPELRKTQGRIGLVASVAGHIAAPKSGPYCASKYAVRAIGQCLSMELEGSGVSCTTWCPGYVVSEISQVDNRGVFREDRRARKNNLEWPTDRAAQVMVRSLDARKREHVFTAHGKIGAWLGRHMPGLVHLALSRGAAKEAKAS